MTATDWKPAKLDDLGFVGRGKSRHRPRNAAFLYGGRYPFFQTGDIKAANLLLTEYSQTYSDEGLAQSKLWKPETLCITIAANIAETAILGIEGCFLDSVVGFVADPEKADVRFVKYFIDTLKLQMQSVSRGTTQDNLSVDKLLTFEFRVPPLPVQRRIAGILSAYDELMENNRRRIRLLEAMARALYREWFVRPCQAGKLPKGYEAKTLGDLAEEVRRTVQPNEIEPETPYFGLEHLPRRSIALTEWGTANEVQSTKHAFKKGKILFGKIRPYFHKVGVAPLDGVSSSDAIVIRPKSPEHFAVVLGCVSSDHFVAHATQTSQGTKMPRANWAVLTKYPVTLPPKPQLRQFNRSVEDIVAQLHNLIFKTRNLRRTRDLLLPRLLSGQVNLKLN